MLIANMNQYTLNGVTPLYVAFQNGRGNHVKLLLRHGVYTSICMNDGSGPLFVVCQTGHKNIVETLLRITLM